MKRANKINKIKWVKIIISVIAFPLLIISLLLFYIQVNQAKIIKKEIYNLNKNYKGLVTIGDTRISIFRDFPNISIKVDDVRVYETKKNNSPIIMDVEDIYVGFNLVNIIIGNYDIQSLLIEEGVFNIIIHKNNTTNIQNALATSSSNDTNANIHLKKIKLHNLDIHKLDEATNTDIETFIYDAEGEIKKSKDHLIAYIESEFELNVIKNNKTTFFKNKQFKVFTGLDLNETTGILKINPSEIKFENSDFNFEGFLDIKNNMDLDLSITGAKPNFDMFIAFAPKDLIPILKEYKNAGEIYFNANIKGPSNKGNIPYVDVQFGANKAFLENTKKAKRIDEMGFKGHFTNGAKRNLTTMEFSLNNMSAKLDEGKLLGSIFVKNFQEPEIDMNIDMVFDLDFMVKFLNIKNVKNTSGKVSLKMNFHDIIDINNPTLTLNKINQAYFSELKIEKLNIVSDNFPAPLKNLNLNLTMDKKGAILKKFNMLMGKSDISITGFVSDLSAIIHHTEKPIQAHLDIKSNFIDITELTKYSYKDSVGFDEQIKDLSLGLSLKTTAKDLTEFKHLPKGEFLIDSLHAQLKHYPHEFHDFHSDIYIDDNDLKIVDFTGYIDNSDFHINGLVHDYSFWLEKELKGDVDLDFNLRSNKLELKDIFFYKSENYIPKGYRNEKFENLALHLNSSMHYVNEGLYSIDIDLDKLNTKMQLHPLKFKNFNGHIHYEDKHIVVEDFHGEIGNTNFTMGINYFTGINKNKRKKDNYINFNSNYIDFDELNNFNLSSNENNQKSKKNKPDVQKHSEAFNLYELPFTDMKYNVNVSHFIHHKIDIQNINAQFRTTPNHYIYIDTLSMNTAGGNINLSGYFNGSDSKNIYLKPILIAKNIDIDKLLFKFENFGQDHLASENLKGQLSTKIKGKIKVYPDFVPDLNNSDIQMDLEVLNGRLKNYNPLLALSDYFGDKNLRNIKFDTLQNHLDVKNGKIIIPKMTIESTLGHLEFSGSQDINKNIDYFIRIPWKTIRKATKYKLLNSKKNSVKIEQEDKIVEVDKNKKTRYLNLKVKGTLEDYKISMGKK